MNIDNLIKKLNDESIEERLNALKKLKTQIPESDKEGYLTNNHVHSRYSFSPYSPTKIVYEAYKNSLAAIGIVDHDSIGGAREFIDAGQILNLPAIVGYEIRTSWDGTPFNNRIINNPQQKGGVYTCYHGVKENKIDEVRKFLSPIRKARNRRNKKMVDNLNVLLAELKLDFENDVISISCFNDGGSITERHILHAAAKRLIEIAGKGNSIINYLQNNLKIELNDKQKTYLLDTECDIYEYDVINILKGNYLEKIYVEAKQPETPSVFDAINFSHEIGAVAAYVYSGDVVNSVTDDKKNQKFEDEFIEELFKYNKEIGFDAIAFMPTRNTEQQLDRVMDLCRKYNLMQINGEDINQPRQPFACQKLYDKKYSHLIDTTWEIINRNKYEQ